MTDWKILTGKQAKIFLKINNILYHGYIISVGKDMMQIRDKYDKIIFIPLDNISQIEEEK